MKLSQQTVAKTSDVQEVDKLKVPTLRFEAQSSCDHSIYNDNWLCFISYFQHSKHTSGQERMLQRGSGPALHRHATRYTHSHIRKLNSDAHTGTTISTWNKIFSCPFKEISLKTLYWKTFTQWFTLRVRHTLSLSTRDVVDVCSWCYYESVTGFLCIRCLVFALFFPALSPPFVTLSRLLGRRQVGAPELAVTNQPALKGFPLIVKYLPDRASYLPLQPLWLCLCWQQSLTSPHPCV